MPQMERNENGLARETEAKTNYPKREADGVSLGQRKERDK